MGNKVKGADGQKEVEVMESLANLLTWIDTVMNPAFLDVQEDQVN
jgi:hypothetical protein